MAILEKKFKQQLKELKWKFYRFYLFSEIISALKHIEISFNETIPTARIKRITTDSIKIEISPSFYTTYVKTANDLMFVLAHETLHYILGHLSSAGEKLDKKYGHEIANAAMDIVINQIIYKELGGEPLEITKFYNEQRGCFVSLAVPPIKMKPHHFKKEECIKWYEMINLYHKRMGTLEILHYLNELTEHINNVHSKEVKAYEDIVVGDGSEGSDKVRIPGRIVDEISEILGWGAGGDPEEIMIKKARVKLKADLLSAIREMADDEEGGIEEVSRGGGVLPFYDRKDFLFIGRNIPNVLYHGNPFPEETRGIRIYADVSGSVQDFLPHVFYALDAIKNWIIFPIYGFSTEVFPISRKDLLKGKYSTTGGTDFNCIARHIMKKRFRNAIIITDGWSRMDKKYAEHLKSSFQILTILVGNKITEYGKKEVAKFSRHVIKFELKREV
jgi:hypothetical protein